MLPLLRAWNVHSQQVIHRDIKPENLIRRSEGPLVLVDFGAAKSVKLTACVQTVQALIATATTRTGLKVFTTILDQTYQTGHKVAEDFKPNMKIVFDPCLPQWNYTAKPELQLI